MVTYSDREQVMHLSKEIWGPDAHEFNPDRWLAPDIASREKYFMPVSCRRNMALSNNVTWKIID